MAKKKKENLDDIPKDLTKQDLKEEQLEQANECAAKYLTQEDVDNLTEVKDPLMVKDEEEWKKVRQKQLEIKNSPLYKDKTFYVPNEAMVSVPVSGMFKTALQDTLNYVFSTMKQEDLIKTMIRIQTGFKNVKSEEIKSGDMAVWTILNLITEINFQAQEQGKLIAGDESFGDAMSEFVDNIDSDPNYKIDQTMIDKMTKEYKSSVPGGVEFTFKDDKESDTNED